MGQLLQALQLAILATLINGSAWAIDPSPSGAHFLEIPPDKQGPQGYLLIPRTAAASATAKVKAKVNTLMKHGPSKKRANIVFVGDGYTSSEMTLYASHVENALNYIFDRQPFKEYKPFYNAYRIDVISNESGVDNDPTLGVVKDTALGMYFWCGDIERLLCMDSEKLNAYAKLAPTAAQVIGVANSTKYGGTGGSYTTVSGGNASALEILLHELGHSLGGLQDEYELVNTPYTGPETAHPNISTLSSTEMALQGTKWANWIGTAPAELFGAEFGLPVSGFEGASLGPTGVYRPTLTSRMRQLDYPFNIVSIESLIIELYKRSVGLIDEATSTSGTLKSTKKLTVRPINPSSHDLSIQWYINSKPIAGATGKSFRLSNYKSKPGLYRVRVVVTDNTPWVRNEKARNKYLTEKRTYYVRVQ